MTIYRSGFRKDCRCCRESSYRERSVTLTLCYDQDGHKIETGSMATLQVIMTRACCTVLHNHSFYSGHHQRAKWLQVFWLRVCLA